ncbi:MAG: FtsK/SpoIIIE domain-containing protein, partial [Culicoidibacterales bacterium]
LNVENSCIPLDTIKTWDYTKTPHALISGVTSGGKTFMLFSLMLQLAADGAELYIADPKQAELASLRHAIPFGDERVASSNHQILKLCRVIVEKMEKRYETYFNQPNVKFGSNYRDFGLQPCFLIVDEVASLIAMLDRKLANELDDYLKQIIMKGRQAGIFLILATQKPEAEVIATAIRDQFGLRIALGQMSKIGLKQTLGEFDELPIAETGTGQGYIFIDGQHWSMPRAFTAPYLDTQTLDFQSVLSELLSKGAAKFKTDAEKN